MPEEDCKVTIDYLSLFNRYIDNQLVLALDGVQDPGNLGTIIRIADWFGIENIFCSHETADCWNPKVVQATMGSIARVKLHYLNLNELIDHLLLTTLSMPRFWMAITFIVKNSLITE